MEKKSEKVLKYILTHTEESKYVVLSIDKMFQDLKFQDSSQQRAQIVGMVKVFIENEYIGCKFYDEEKICAVSMPAGRTWATDSGARESVKKKNWKSALISFFCALVGAFCGAFLSGLIPPIW